MSGARLAIWIIVTGLMLVRPAAADNVAGPIYIFAAASMTEAVEAIAVKFSRASGHKLLTSFASSSTLARQIEAGAPADIFISANLRWMAYLRERRHVDADSVRPFAGNRLAVIVPAGDRLDDLSDLMGRRVAIGDPDHVPAGAYARRFLERIGLWASLAPNIARAKDVRAALALVARGEADAGIVYRTDARITDRVTVAYEVPADADNPIMYEIAMLSGSSRRPAKAVIDYVFSADGQAILHGLGFVRAADLGNSKP